MDDDLKKAQGTCGTDYVDNLRAHPTEKLYAAIDKLDPHIDSLTKQGRELRKVAGESEENAAKLEVIRNKLAAFHKRKKQIVAALMPGTSDFDRIQDFGTGKTFSVEIDGSHYRQEAPTREKATELARVQHEYLHDPSNKVEEVAPGVKGGKKTPEQIKAAEKKAAAAEKKAAAAGEKPTKERAPRGAKAKADMEKARALAMAYGAAVPVKVGTVKGQEKYVIFDKDGNEIGVPALIDRHHPEGHPQAGELKHLHQRKHEAAQQAEQMLTNLGELASEVARVRRPSRKERDARDEERSAQETDSLKSRIERTAGDATSPHEWSHAENRVLKNYGHTMTPAQYRQAARMYYNAVGNPKARGEGSTVAERTIQQFYQKKLDALRKKSPKGYSESSKPLIAERDELLSQIKSKLDSTTLNREHDRLVREATQDPEMRSGVPPKILAAAEKRAKEGTKSEVAKQTEKLREDIPSSETLEEKHAPMVVAVDKHFESLGGDKAFNPPSKAKEGETHTEVLAREGYQEEATSDKNEQNELRPWLTDKYTALFGGAGAEGAGAPDTQDEISDPDAYAEAIAGGVEEGAWEGPEGDLKTAPSVSARTDMLGESGQKALAAWEKIAATKPKNLEAARQKLAKKWAAETQMGEHGSDARKKLVGHMRGEKSGLSGSDLNDFVKDYGKKARGRGRTDVENANLGVLKDWVKDLKSTLGSSRKKAYNVQDIPLGESELSEGHTVFKDQYREQEAKLLEDIIGRLKQSDEDTPFAVLSDNGKKEIEELIRKSFDWTYGMFIKDVFPGVFLNLNLFKNINSSEEDKVRAFNNSFGKDTRGVNPSTMNSEIEGEEEDEDSETKKSLGLYLDLSKATRKQRRKTKRKKKKKRYQDFQLKLPGKAPKEGFMMRRVREDAAEEKEKENRKWARRSLDSESRPKGGVVDEKTKYAPEFSQVTRTRPSTRLEYSQAKASRSNKDVPPPRGYREATPEERTAQTRAVYRATPGSDSKKFNVSNKAGQDAYAKKMGVDVSKLTPKVREALSGKFAEFKDAALQKRSRPGKLSSAAQAKLAQAEKVLKNPRLDAPPLRFQQVGDGGTPASDYKAGLGDKPKRIPKLPPFNPGAVAAKKLRTPATAPTDSKSYTRLRNEGATGGSDTVTEKKGGRVTRSTSRTFPAPK